MKRLLPLLILAVAATPGFAETTPKLAAVEAAVASLSQRPGMASATVGFALMRLGDAPEIVLDVNGKQSFIPASTTKVITSIVALDKLGPDLTFDTKLGYRGTLTEGTLTGDLVIQGGGDPTLAEYGWDELFTTWATQVKEAGITKIEGRVLGDSSYFQGPARPGSWAWSDVGNYYASGAQGLNFYNNTYKLNFMTGSVGKQAKLMSTLPKLPSITFHNEMLTGSSSSGDQGYVYAAPFSETAFLRGSVPAGGTFTIKGALPEPALTCARLFHEHLTKTCEITGDPSSLRKAKGARKAPVGDFTEILTKKSAPLSNLLQRMNHKSLNLFAETVLRRLGKATDGSGSIASGIASVGAYFSKEGITKTGFAMHDGAGLSRLNVITPRQMAYMLKAANRSPHVDVFRRTLPIAGRSGTLKSVARGTAAVGRVRAKSGTIERVKCYAGYVDTTSGERYAFAIMVNNYAKKYSDVKPGIEAVMARMGAM